jgi:DNA-binding response OmpR family regulator
MNNTVLIADDSSTMRKFMSFALEMKDYRVIAAVDGLDAIEKLAQNQVDLAIIDLNMPHMDGFELLEHIRSSSHYEDLPIIILSSEQKEEVRQRGLDAGANEYLYKPFNAQIIQDCVSNYLPSSDGVKGESTA